MAETDVPHAPQMWCPRGDGPLVTSMANGLHETCDGCHGFAVTIWLLDEMLLEGCGPELWRSSAGAALDGQPCPSCRRPMARVHAPPTAAGTAEVELCRNCELVWVEPAAQALLPTRPELTAAPVLGPSAGLGSPDPTHCPNCGAPFSRADGERCPFCKEAIARAPLEVGAPDLAEHEAEERAERRRSSGLVEAAIEAEINGG